jgi:putative intracellular protease/amidase
MRPVKPPPQPAGPPEWKVKLEAKRRARRRFWRRFAAIVLVLGIAGFGFWILSLPPTPTADAPPPISQAETQSIVAALAPTRRTARPVVAIIGINEGTETTDYLMPYGILKRADVAEVFALATRPGPIEMFPAFKVEPTATIADFDAKHPSGADYVIVPQMSRADDPDALNWIRSQAEKGAIVIGVCAGARIVANTGLLDDKRATTHWYYLEGMLAKHPSIRYVRDRRFVVDGDVATTTGITASMPMSLTLIEAIAGREKAVSVAADLGLTHWDASHSSGTFTFTRPFALTAVRNTLAFWQHEKLGLKLELGADEVSLALVADAWSRTYRSRAVTFAADTDAGITRNGLKIIPDEIRASWDADTLLEPLWERPAARALDGALAAIATRYGASTRNLVAMQLEYR